MRDELSRPRRALPWEKVDKQYLFDGLQGKETLTDLFEQRSQLIVYHFMFPPEAEQGCKDCSFWADSFNGSVVHLSQRDVTFVAISRAPYAKIEPFKKGWDGVSSGFPHFTTISTLIITYPSPLSSSEAECSTTITKTPITALRIFQASACSTGMSVMRFFTPIRATLVVLMP